MTTQYDLNKDLEKLCHMLEGFEGVDTVNAYIKDGYPGIAKIGYIQVDKSARCQGIGTRVVTRICQWADDNNVTLVLTPAQRDPRTGTTSYKRLEKFYKRFGFTTNRGRNRDFTHIETMIRRK